MPPFLRAPCQNPFRNRFDLQSVDTKPNTRQKCGKIECDDFPPPPPVSADPVEATCSTADGAQGVADARGIRCCPLGCGLCGGTGCGQVPMAKIFPDGRELPDDAKSSAYCCITEAFTNTTRYCDEAGVEPPCLVRDGMFIVRGCAVGWWGGGQGAWSGEEALRVTRQRRR